jgi:hypothetical protein
LTQARPSRSRTLLRRSLRTFAKRRIAGVDRDPVAVNV